MTFYEYRILLLEVMSISLREKQYTVAYMKIKKVFNAIINAACISTHYGPVSAVCISLYQDMASYLCAFIKVSKTSVLVSL